MGRFAGTLFVGVACALAFASTAAARTFYVNSTADAGTGAGNCATVTTSDIPATRGDACTLPEAINAVTSAGGTNTIAFIVCGPYTITKQLANIPGGTTLDGTQVVNTDPGCYDTGSQSLNYGYANLEGSGTGPGAPATRSGTDRKSVV